MWSPLASNSSSPRSQLDEHFTILCDLAGSPVDDHLAVLASLAGAAVVIMLVPPRYTANTRVLLDVIKPDPVTGQVMSAQFARAYTQTQIQLIQDLVSPAPSWTKSAGRRIRPCSRGMRFLAIRTVRAANWLNLSLIRPMPSSSRAVTSWRLAIPAASPDAARTIADALRRAYIHAAVQTKRDTAAKSADWYEAQAGKAAAAAEHRRGHQVPI